MHLDVAHLKEFYDLPLGRMLRVLVGHRMRRIWPQLKGRKLLGLGYATPFVRPYMKEAAQVAVGMPAAQGVVKWPREKDAPNKAFLMEPNRMPLPDSSFDRIMMVHSLDMASDPDGLIEEVYRVLAPGGRIMIVVPNRRGYWCRSEASPFGYGRPYSRSQLENFLGNHALSVVGREEALYVPPINSRLVMKSARSFERMGNFIWPAFAGLVLMEAEKRVYRGLHSRSDRFARALRPVFLPEGKTAGAQIFEEPRNPCR
ncbi:class I SAM-dependent methyltransferase [Rhodobacteraceae bacterium RKSG542]|uniref:class I SAM-dependent methyltransferase n=1 Tax=Pseudovibrio flavus TaxID=2529854 RepID=UPI0012BBDB95|nr:class I SAM-dependent methyltransferase [Pseudovibrio flavus]MTI18357.1 class I SAM-dependent methyltransferase [Pseudovibrio flavus]